jgi:hypothetical protein
MTKKLVLAVSVLMLASVLMLPVPIGALSFGMDTNLGSVNASFLGEVAGDGAGLSVSSAGDVNGDGYDDLLIGAAFNSAGGTGAGQAYLILGKPSGWAMDTSLANADASFLGEKPNDMAGDVVSGAGDVNGDGYDDFLIASPANPDGGGDHAGQTYLIFGKASGWAMDTGLGSASASFWGEDAWDYSGSALAPAGDVNGDGFDDFLIGASWDGTTGAMAGITYLIFGKASGWAMDTDLSTATASFTGEATMDSVGSYLSPAGDVNGDGFDDFLIGAASNDENGANSGQTYLILGKASGWTKLKGLANADASFQGEAASDYSGSVGGPGDVNGDGFDDILIGARSNSAQANMAGQTYVIFGKASGWAMDSKLANANASFWGEVANDGSGTSVDIAGDVNGDGYDDILLGASGSGSSAGQTYLVLGKPSGWAMDTKLLNANASFIGEASSDYSGQVISSAGDANGDGYDDLLIGAYQNDASGSAAGQAYLVFPDANTKPTVINSVKAYSDETFTQQMAAGKVNDTVFVELKGTDGDPSAIDLSSVNLTSNAGDPKGFTLRLIETGKATGTYRGNFTLKERTSEIKKWLGVNWNDVAHVRSVQNSLKVANITVKSIVLMPSVDDTAALEDTLYNIHYWTANAPSISWTYSSNASWLSWDSTAHNLSGTPDNSDVGSYYVRLNITHAVWGSDEHNFTMVVANTPPELTTTNVLAALEDVPYSVDYNSTDDGQGVVTYHLKTNAGAWLTLDPATGVLNGTPGNDDVGSFYVNVTVDDGNGGSDWTNFTLIVTNTNDHPTITTTDTLSAVEDQAYSVQYTAIDVDADILTWHFATSASSWLTFNTSSGLLSGTPTNGDVGSYWVNVSVTDPALAQDHHNFTLTVVNSNDGPQITNVNVLTAKEDDLYSVQYTATDVDLGDVLTWHLATNASGWLGINSSTGLLSGTPVNSNVGKYWVNVSVTDKALSVAYQNFTLTVLNTNDVPLITSTPVTKALTAKLYQYDVNATDVDVGDKLTYALDIKPTGMVINASTGLITWTPTEAQLGNQSVTVSVSDGKVFVNQSFKVLVSSSNHKPTVVSIPDATIKVGKTFVYSVVAADVDSGDTLTYSTDGQTSGMTISATGVISWKPIKSQVGEHTVTVTVSDGKGSVSTNFKVTVKPKDKTQTGLDMRIVAVIALVLIIVIIAVVALLLSRKKSPPEEEDEPQEEGDEPQPEDEEEPQPEEEAEPEPEEETEPGSDEEVEEF